MPVCNVCNATTFSDRTGLAACDACPAGRYGTKTNLTACNECIPGEFQPSFGAKFCEQCEPGRYSVSGLSSCAVCDTGKVQESFGRDSCVPCLVNSKANIERTECLCAVGYYLPSTYLPGSNIFSCIECPIGADCSSSGNKWTNLRASAGFWRATNTSDRFYRCLLREHCLGGALVGSALSVKSDVGCIENREGILCSHCKTGFREATGGICTTCPSSDASFALVALGAIALIFLLYVQIAVVVNSHDHLLRRIHKKDKENQVNNPEHEQGAIDELSDSDDDQDEAEAAEAVEAAASASPKSKKTKKLSELEEGVEMASLDKSENEDSQSEADEEESEEEDEEENSVIEWSYNHLRIDVVDPRNGKVVAIGAPAPETDFTYKLKVIMGFLQITTSIASTLEIQWPSTFKQVLLYLDVVNFNVIMQQVTSTDCVDGVSYYDKFLIILLTPLCLTLLIALVLLVPFKLKMCCFKQSFDRRRYVIRFYQIGLYLLFLLYPSVSSTVLGHYICKDIDSRSFLIADLRIECFTDKWTQFAFGAVALVLLYPIGIPLFFFAILKLNYKHLADDVIRAQLGFLYDGYRRNTWWFEMLDMAHKLFLTSFVAFFDQSSQISVGMSVVILYLLILLLLNPYLRKDDDVLHLFAQIEIFLLLLAGHVFYNMPVGGFYASDDAIMSVALIGICFGLLLGFLYLSFIAVRSFISNWLKERARDKLKKKRKENLAKQALSSGQTDAKHAEESDSGSEGEGEEKEPSTSQGPHDVHGESRPASTLPSLPSGAALPATPHGDFTSALPPMLTGPSA